MLTIHYRPSGQLRPDSFETEYVSGETLGDLALRFAQQLGLDQRGDAPTHQAEIVTIDGYLYDLSAWLRPSR